ncbi:hypothetical protein [Mycobacterium sp. E2327]|uniref:hypothetical protein n=1 Tax=Mycobacterium sp. E2327 TaxID=1834132 RepID=UPI0012EA924A|nr:hypothetical protein [Mycobacterium sp. E2327]
MARKCVFCGRTPVTSEHIFKRAFRKKLNLPAGNRRLDRQDGLDSPMTTRPDPLFELTVRYVCSKCNSGWMNRLDLAVERWVINPDSETCEPSDLRRWAIKVAIMYSLTAQPSTVLPRTDYDRLFSGDDLNDWYVFIGRSSFPEWRHGHVGHGVRCDTTGEMLGGITHASWVVGTSVVSALRPAGDAELHLLKAFRQYNVFADEPLVEIPCGADTFPDLLTHRPLRRGEAASFIWFFAAHPASPVYPHNKAGAEKVRDAVAARRKELGLGPGNPPRQHQK